MEVCEVLSNVTEPIHIGVDAREKLINEKDIEILRLTLRIQSLECTLRCIGGMCTFSKMPTYQLPKELI